MICPGRITITATGREAQLDHSTQEGDFGGLVERGVDDPEPEKACPIFGRVHHCHRSRGHDDRIAQSHRIQSILAISGKTQVAVEAELIKG